MWPFKSKIPCLESIKNDADGNIVLDLTDKSFRFNEKDILSVKYESDFYSPTYVRTESSNWHLFIQLVITFIVTCGIMNAVIYYSSMSHYQNFVSLRNSVHDLESHNLIDGEESYYLSEFIKSDRSFSSYLVIFNVLGHYLQGVYIFFPIIFLVIYYVTLLLKRLIRKYILLTKRPFYLKKDLVFIRLHNQNINFRINQKGHTDIVGDLFRKKVDRTTVKKKVRIIELYRVDYSPLVYLGIIVVALGAFYLNYDEPYWWYKLFESHEGLHGEIRPPLLTLTEKMSNWTAYFAVLDRGMFGLFFDGVMSGLGLVLPLIISLILLVFVLIIALLPFFFPSILVSLFGEILFPKIKKEVLNWIVYLVLITIIFFLVAINEPKSPNRNPGLLGEYFINYWISVWAILLIAGLFFLVKGIIEHRRKKETNDAEKPKKAPALRFIDYYPEELELRFSDGRVLTVGQFIDSSNPLLKDIYAFDFFAYKYINFELLEQFKG